jgi:L-lysine 2,3-aminomutase
MSGRALSTTPEETEELQRLHGEYVEATTRVAESLHTGGEPLDSEALDVAVAEDARAARVMHRIKEIYRVRRFRLKGSS